MDILRTPERCFATLPDFGLRPSYADVPDGDGGMLRMAWIDAGPSDGPVALLTHGEPTWSYLYRRLVPAFTEAGFRVVAPDLVGFGRSDKPSATSDHTFARHVTWLESLLFGVLDLRGINLLGHDWGGSIALGLLPAHQERFSCVLMSNSGVARGHVDMPGPWWEYKRMIETTADLSISALVNDLAQSPLPPAVSAAYDAPFPDGSFMAGPRAMPGLVPVTPDHPTTAASVRMWDTLDSLTLPFLCAFSEGEVFTRPMAQAMQERIPGARGRTHPLIPGAGHLVQEEAPEALAEVAVDFFREAQARS